MINSLWADYYKERLNWDCEGDPNGFILYALRPPTATIEDVYIAPEKRRSNLALSLANRVSAKAREAGCTEILTQVFVGTIGAERAVRVNIAYGFKIISADAGRILFRKEL